MNTVFFLILFSGIVVSGIGLIFLKKNIHSLMCFFIINILVGIILILNNASAVGIVLILCSGILSYIIASKEFCKKNTNNNNFSLTSNIGIGTLSVTLFSIIIYAVTTSLIPKKNTDTDFIAGVTSLYQNSPSILFLLLFIVIICGLTIISLSQFDKKYEDDI